MTLTILEVDDFWSRPDEGVRRNRTEKLRVLERREDLRYVFVQADHQRYAEARGGHVVIEHIVPTVSLRPLTELIQLHRPTAIVCRATIVMLLSVGLASLRLTPRPALIGRFRGVGLGERPAWKLTRSLRSLLVSMEAIRLASLGPAKPSRASHPSGRGALRPFGGRLQTEPSRVSYVRGFDAVLVADRAEADEALELGLDRLYLVPADDFAGEVARIRELVEIVRTGRQVPTGVHDVVA